MLSDGHSMQRVQDKFKELCNTPSDINEHLMTLAKYAKQCESILELGVRGCVSSWAFLLGLLLNEKSKKQLIMNDITPCNILELIIAASSLNVRTEYHWCNDLDLKYEDRSIDMVFIDTWHVYGQLKRELAKFGPIAKKFIAMHDTTVDEIYGETIRCGMNAEIQSRESGIPIEEINKGIRPAVDEFLRDNPNWILEERFTHCNGLTVLRRID
jgi:hypothetical protein